MFWNRVERSGDRPAQQLKKGGALGDPVVAPGRRRRPRGRGRAREPRPKARRRGGDPVGHARRVGPGRLRDLLDRRRDDPDLPDVPARARPVHRQRRRRQDADRRGPDPARQGPRGAGQDGGSRAHRRHAGPTPGRRPRAPHRELGRAAAPGSRAAAGAPARAGRARRRHRAGRHRDHRLHVRHHRPAQGRDADARQPSRRARGRRPDHEPITEGEVHLLFLPLAHSFARLESFIGVHRGLTTAFAENIDKLRENLPEMRPHFICSVPRVFEKVYAGVVARAEGGLAAQAQDLSLGGRRGQAGVRAQAGAASPCRGLLALKYRLAEKLVFSKMQAALGGRLRFAVSGGAPLSPRDRRVLPRRRHPHPRGLRPHRDVSRAHHQPPGPTSSSARSAGRCPAST